MYTIMVHTLYVNEHRKPLALVCVKIVPIQQLTFHRKVFIKPTVRPQMLNSAWFITCCPLNRLWN